MLLCLRLRSVAISVLVSIVLLVLQMVRSTAYAQDHNSGCTRNTACSDDGKKEMEDIEALNSVLATVAAKLDDLEKRVADQNLHDGIYTEIDRRRPFRIPIADLCNVQRELERLALACISHQ